MRPGLDRLPLVKGTNAAGRRLQGIAQPGRQRCRRFVDFPLRNLERLRRPSVKQPGVAPYRIVPVFADVFDYPRYGLLRGKGLPEQRFVPFIDLRRGRRLVQRLPFQDACPGLVGGQYPDVHLAHSGFISLYSSHFGSTFNSLALPARVSSAPAPRESDRIRISRSPSPADRSLARPGPLPASHRPWTCRSS